MAISKLPEQCVAEGIFETPTFPFLLEQGFHFVQLGCYAEGLALLTLACEHLPPDQVHFAELLDDFIQGSVEYQRVQQEFQKACTRFVKAHSEQQALVAAFGSRLSLLKTSFCPSDYSPGQLKVTEEMKSQTAPTLSFMANQSTSPFPQPFMKEDTTFPELFITCFGRFEVYRQQQLVTLCQNRSGQAVLRYLVAQSGYRATPDALMEAIWPDDEPESTRRKLQVAISALRRSLNVGYECSPGTGYILCKNGFYQLHPSVHLVTDVDTFIQHYEAGHRNQGSEMVNHYEQACRLYTGAFLPEDLYANWTQRRREQLSQMYQSMCGAIAEQAFKNGYYENAAYWAHTLLTENPCDEAAHRLLMLAYAHQGRRNEALRQYQRCERILYEELGVSPMFETLQVFQDIFHDMHEPK